MREPKNPPSTGRPKVTPVGQGAGAAALAAKCRLLQEMRRWCKEGLEQCHRDVGRQGGTAPWEGAFTEMLAKIDAMVLEAAYDAG